MPSLEGMDAKDRSLVAQCIATRLPSFHSIDFAANEFTEEEVVRRTTCLASLAFLRGTVAAFFRAQTGPGQRRVVQQQTGASPTTWTGGVAAVCGGCAP